MKKVASRKVRVVLSLALAAVVCLASATNTEAASKKYVKSLKVAKSSVTITEGSKASVNATVKVSGSASKKVTVKSSNSKVATVKAGSASKKGVSKITITAKKAGKATITVKTSAKNSKKKQVSKTIKVTVKGKSSVNPSTPGTQSSTQPSAKPSSQPSAQSSAKPSAAPSTAPTNPAAKMMDPDYGATGFTESDYTVVTGTKPTYVEFKINKEVVSEEELKAQGYNVSGGVASTTIICDTATYTFNKLPGSLNEIKKIKLDNKFAPMAATICAFHTFDTTPGRYYLTQYQYNPLCQMLNHIGNDKFCKMNNFDATHLYDQFSAHPELKNAYFGGAAPTNNYTPSKPYTITMVESPYIIKEKTMVSGTYRPETHMILIKIDGDDAQRYIDVWESSDGNWYALNEETFDTYKQLTGSVKTPVVKR